VGCARLEGVEAYEQLGEVYRALRLVVNGFQPSMKLRGKCSRASRGVACMMCLRLPCNVCWLLAFSQRLGSVT
jgi:hypothetical protein